jgi:phosphoglycerol transferase MdoB-like AlkP superfamily enzyme
MKIATYLKQTIADFKVGYFWVILIGVHIPHLCELIYQDFFSLPIIFTAFYQDLQLALVLTLLIFLLYLLFFKVFQRHINVILGCLLGLILLFTALFSVYYVRIKVPFDAAVFNLPKNEVHLLLQPYYNYALAIVIGFIVLYSIYTFFICKIINWSNRVLSVLHCLVLSIVGLSFWFFTTEHTTLESNKVAIFAHSYANYRAQLSTPNIFILDKNYWKTKSNLNKPVNASYPLVANSKYEDVLSPYFNFTAEKPNIVYIIVESLGKSVQGDGAFYGSFTPFLDSLANKSLYFPNFFATAARTFNVLPSSLGSLPYGEHAFADIGLSKKLPYHYSLISILKQNNYTSSFHCPVGNAFNNMDAFMSMQGSVINEEWDERKYRRIPENGDYSWGFDDESLFKRYLNTTSIREKKPFIDVLLTISTHGPFQLNDEQKHSAAFINHVKKFGAEKRKQAIVHKEMLQTVLYTDGQIRNLFSELSKRPEFKNTIFVFFGDHAMQELPHSDKIESFHTPLIIYSPLLKRSKAIKAVNSQLDLAPTFLAMLTKSFGVVQPAKTAWLGTVLDTNKNFQCKKQFPIMLGSRLTTSYIFNNNFALDGNVYNFNSKFELKPEKNEFVSKSVLALLKYARELNIYSCNKNKIIPKNDYFKSIKNCVKFDYKIADSTMYKQEYMSKTISHYPKPKTKYIAVTFSFEYYSETVIDENNSPHFVANKLKKDGTSDWQSIKFKTKEIRKWRKASISLQKVWSQYAILGFNQLDISVWNKDKVKVKFRNIKLEIEEVE